MCTSINQCELSALAGREILKARGIMIIKQLRQSCFAALIISLFVSCGGSESSSSSGNDGGPGAGQQDRDINNDQDGPKVCQGSRVLKVLENGRNIISRLTSDRNVIVNWKVSSGKKVSVLDFPVNPYAVSPEGKYIIRQIDYRKYQIIRLGDNKRNFNKVITLNAAYSPMPKLEFSADGENLVLNYRPYAQGYSHQIDIYNLRQERIISSMTARNISFARVTRDSKFYLVGYRDGYKNVIQKIDIDNIKTVYELSLNKYERFSEVFVADNTFVVRGQNGYYFHDLHNGSFLYKKKLKYLFDIGSEGKNALVSESWNEIKIIDLRTGSEVVREKTPTGLVLSSCQLVDNPLKLLCEDSINQGKIAVWNIGESTASTKCF